MMVGVFKEEIVSAFLSAIGLINEKWLENPYMNLVQKMNTNDNYISKSQIILHLFYSQKIREKMKHMLLH